MSQHLEISVKSTPLWAEHVSYLLMDKLGCSGSVIEEDGTVKGYLYSEIKPDLTVLSEWDVSTQMVQDEDWAESWKKYWHPIKIGEKIVICPSWEEYTANEGEIIISLDPGCAFGTGTHPTTKLCVQALEQVIPEFGGEISLADVGTGSGILSIAAAKLGVSSIMGVDNDPSVIPVAVENTEINEIKAKYEYYEGSAADIKGTYDIVTANILAEIIIEIMDELKSLLKPEGVMILSGIIERKATDVENAIAKAGLKSREVLKENGWVAIKASF